MKFLVDAQLPRRMADWLRAALHDAIHTFDLPDGNRSSDAKIIAEADAQSRVVITKDADFVNSHLLSGRPAKLLLISSGNLSNPQMEQLFVPLIATITVELQNNAFVESKRHHRSLICRSDLSCFTSPAH
jgi:predicted nuclease of predicted toxin-antitoxin system